MVYDSKCTSLQLACDRQAVAAVAEVSRSCDTNQQPQIQWMMPGFECPPVVSLAVLVAELKGKHTLKFTAAFPYRALCALTTGNAAV
jgi:hypothetical protein